MNMPEEMDFTTSSRSMLRFFVALAFLLMGLAAVFDIQPMLDSSLGFFEGLKRTIETGPFSGDMGVNVIGSVFVLTAVLMIHNIFNATKLPPPCRSRWSCHLPERDTDPGSEKDRRCATTQGRHEWL